MYFQPLCLWENSSGVLLEADFVSQFSFMIHTDDWAPGDGIAFFLTKPPFRLPKVTDGSCVGLVTYEEKANSSANPFVTVEFDTFKNFFDPRDLQEHVGINVNSMVSRATAPWSCNLKSWPKIFGIKEEF
ncbi:hypothetical protein TIFTF001_027415 [Ficus carica]|uniref:Legume lectin domain-containing protein n=1 Tax=Ficus carica TaxID=3494 RepID=A0AA88DMX7_FICCA|nr:hypothetical protein TIFTF001_027415 [Ficus carica]